MFIIVYFSLHASLSNEIHLSVYTGAKCQPGFSSGTALMATKRKHISVLIKYSTLSLLNTKVTVWSEIIVHTQILHKQYVYMCENKHSH